MNTLVRIASVAGMLTLALSSAVSASTLRLVPLTKHTVGVTVRNCAVPMVPAAVTDADPADLPPIAVEMNVTGVTTVRITLNPDGWLTDRAVIGSSGNRWIDQAALRSALFSRYSAEVRDCERVGGDYALIVDFTR